MSSTITHTLVTPPPLSPPVASGVVALRDYLQRVSFQQIYKYVTSSNFYLTVPSVVSQRSAGQVANFFDTVLADCPGLELLQCLMIGRAVERGLLDDEDAATADRLIDAELLRAEGDQILPASLQLISAFGTDLLVDRRIHFATGSLHEVYVGVDSYLMLYYINPAELRPECRAVDLCTGTGIAALYLSQHCDHVVATDIGSVPLHLVQINRLLNRKEATIAVRDQPLDETLDGSTQFDVLTCNPPFVAYPPGVDATLYSRGTDIDGLGYLRTIINRLPDVLTPGGTAYLVADLVGDMHGPHFVHELREFAAAHSLAVDCFIDGVLSAEDQVPAFTSHMASANPQRDRDELAAEFVRFQREVLRADRYYLTTLRLQVGSGRPGVRVFRRYAAPAPVPAPAESSRWPELLIQN